MPSDDDRVSLVRCEDYAPEQVAAAVRRAVDLLGGLDRFISPGQRVLVKPNLLQPVAPDECVTTHPEMVTAVARMLRDHGCEVVIADSAGGGTPYTEARLRKLYDITGMSGAAEAAGAELGLDATYREVACPEGRVIKRFQVITPAAEADAIVVVSKAKTHVLTAMTGATKCIFGVLPGMEKPSFHGRLPDLEGFCDMLLDLNLAMRPELQIMDAVMGMEGDGPSGGEPRRIGAVLAAADPVALDIVAAGLMGFRAEDLPTIRRAAERGMAPDGLRVKVVGEEPGSLTVTDFKHSSSTAASKLGVGAPVLGRLLRAYALRPVVSKERCNGCGRCARSCPRETIRVVRGKARISHGRCIRCYCCHEMCENRAIELRRSTGGRFIARIMEGRNARSDLSPDEQS
ncbi:MAG: DUF362 domain-containing protein [Methanomassiliicoccus sp.]|nr:DUF362 domain-containing protein [Methanomassiliicoccus sp.]